MTNRILGLDGLRALACLLVISHHVLPRLPSDGSLLSELIQTVSEVAQAGVSIFFVLSGFLLSLPFWKSAFNNTAFPSFKVFVSRRLLRIAPGYYIALTVSFILSIVVFEVGFDGQLVWRWLSGMVFINSFHPVTMFPSEINGPLWSIGFEVISYSFLLVFLWLALIVHRKPSFTALLKFFLVGTVLVFIFHVAWMAIIKTPTVDVGWDYGLVGFARTWVPHTNVFAMFLHFLIGVLSAALYIFLAASWKTSMKADGLLIGFQCLCLLALAVMSVLVDDAFLGVYKTLYMWPVFPMMIGIALVFLPFTLTLHRFLEIKVLRYLAKISFGLYVWHMVVVDLVAKYVFKDYLYGGQMLLSHWFMATALSVGLSILIADLSWRYIESPVLKLSFKRRLLAKV